MVFELMFAVTLGVAAPEEHLLYAAIGRPGRAAPATRPAGARPSPAARPAARPTSPRPTAGGRGAGRPKASPTPALKTQFRNARVKPNLAKLVPQRGPKVHRAVTPQGMKVGQKGWLNNYVNSTKGASHIGRHVGVSQAQLASRVKARRQKHANQPISRMNKDTQHRAALMNKFYAASGPKGSGLKALRVVNAQSSFTSKAVATQAINRTVAQHRRRIDFWAAASRPGDKLKLRSKNVGMGSLGTHVSHDGRRAHVRNNPRGVFVLLERNKGGHIVPVTAYPG